MKPILFSIIMPTYNVGKYVVDSVRSVLQQTFQGFELIMVDDASTDDTVTQIEQNFSSLIASGKIRLIKSLRNGGPATARQKGLEAAQGVYCSFIDSDDTYAYPNLFQEIADIAERESPDMIMFKFKTAHGHLMLKKRFSAPRRMDTKEAVISKIRTGSGVLMWHSVVNKFYKRSVVLQNNISFTKGWKSAKDVRFNDDILPCLKNVYFLNTYGYIYNCTNTSSLTRGSRVVTPPSKLDFLKRWERETAQFDSAKELTQRVGCWEECRDRLETDLCIIYLDIAHQASDKSVLDDIKAEKHYQQISKQMLKAEVLYRRSVFKKNLRNQLKKIYAFLFRR